MKKQLLLFAIMLLPIVASAYDAEINGVLNMKNVIVMMDDVRCKKSYGI